MFSPSSQSPLLAISGDNLFRLCPDDTLQAKIISETILSLDIQNVVVLQRADAWADGIYNYFVPLFTETDGSILNRIRYDGDTSSFTDELETLDEIIK